MIERMAWDSNFFGLEIGRYQMNLSENPGSVDQLLSASPFDVVYLLQDQPSNRRISEIECIAPLADRKLTFRKQVSPVDVLCGQEVLPYDGSLNNDLLELALMSGEYSRFNLDMKFRPYFRKLYTAWIQKSLSGEMADAVYVARSGTDMTGFITLVKKNHTGQIGLVAVHPDYRGMGVASSLMKVAHAWFLRQGCEDATVVTQRDNRPACWLYEKCGYALSSETAIFHWWKTQGEIR